MWQAIRAQVVGPVRLVYAELDDGLIHKMSYQDWISESGSPWPYKDEFEVGCTLEHAGYYVNWLTAFFGPTDAVTAFSSQTIPGKETDCDLTPNNTPDFSVACIRFKSDVVARITCSILAPHNHELKVVGETGVISTHDCWHYDSPVYIKRLTKTLVRRRVKMSDRKKRYPLVRRTPRFKEQGAAKKDFCRGVAEMAAPITEKRPNRLGSEVSLHNNELVIAIQTSFETGSTYHLTTTFDPVEPMEWATGNPKRKFVKT